MLCDERGELLFDQASADDLFAINRLRASSLSLIHQAMEGLNVTTTDAAIDLGNVSLPVIDSSSI
jgi:hypothetical protein